MRTLITLVIALGCLDLSAQTEPNNLTTVKLDGLTNVFLSVNDFKFTGSGTKTAYIEPAKLKESIQSEESKPENEDAEGNWGTATEGLRLSLRFEKKELIQGDPIAVVLLLRNVTNRDLAFSRYMGGEWDFSFTVTNQDGQPLLEHTADLWGTTGAHPLLIYPMTQGRFVFTLNNRFDLNMPGTYEITAKTRVGKMDETASVEIRSAPATLVIRTK